MTLQFWQAIGGLFVAGIMSAVAWTWAIAGTKDQMETRVERVASSVEVLSSNVTAIEARTKLEQTNITRRVEELENIARSNQQLLVAVEGLKTDIRYLSSNVAEIKKELKEKQ